MAMCISNTLQRLCLFVAQAKMPKNNEIHLSILLNNNGVLAFKSSKTEIL